MRETTVTKFGPERGFVEAGVIATIDPEMAIQERVLPLMTVTESAAVKIKQLMAEEEDVSVLRVAIQGGGCSGFQYGLGFDRGAVEGDHEFEVHGVQVVEGDADASVGGCGSGCSA